MCCNLVLIIRNIAAHYHAHFRIVRMIVRRFNLLKIKDLRKCAGSFKKPCAHKLVSCLFSSTYESAQKFSLPLTGERERGAWMPSLSQHHYVWESPRARKTNTVPTR